MADQKNIHDDEQFIVRRPIGVAQILTELCKNKTMLNMSFSRGQEQGLTTVIGVNREKRVVYIDKSLDAGFNQKLLNSNAIVFSKTDGIKVKWTSKKIVAVKLKDGEAFKIALPKSVYRFQRREYFRLLTPVAVPIICTIPYLNETMDDTNVFEMMLTDISLGGIGTMVVDELSPSLVLEKDFEHCKIKLPDISDVEVILRVKNMTEIILANGAKKHRVGFEFVNLPHIEQRLIQNYVFHLEREALNLR